MTHTIYPTPPEVPFAQPGSPYPANWLEITLALKAWTGGRCEGCWKLHDPENGYTLTVHHLDKNTQNNHWSNLVVLCQRCHLRVQAAYVPGQKWMFERPLWAEIRGL